MGDSLSGKGLFLSPQLAISPASATTLLSPILFPLILLLEKRQEKLKGYFEVLEISICISSCCRPPYMLPPPHGSGQELGKHKAGMGFPSGRGKAGRQHWKALLVDHKDHTRSLSAAPAMAKALLSQGGRRAGTARHVRTAGERPHLSDAGICSLLIGQQLPAPARVRDALK